MQTELNITRPISSEYIVDICKRNNISDYIINPDLSIRLYCGLSYYTMMNLVTANITIMEVTRTLSLRTSSLQKLPKCPEKIGWNLILDFNDLASLVGLPKIIGGNLCMINNKLEHSPENFEILLNTYVGGSIDGDPDFMLAYNRYKTIKDIIE